MTPAQEARLLVDELDGMKVRALQIAARLAQLEGQGGTVIQHKPYKQKPTQQPQPNHFISLKLAHNERLVETVTALQAKILETHPELEALLVSPSLLHLTLFVFHSAGPEDLAKAVNCIRCFEETLSGPAVVQLTMAGLNSFGTDVLFAEVATESATEMDFLKQINIELSARFLEAGLLTEQQKARAAPGKFKPHVTLFKSSKGMGKKKAPKKIPKDAWQSLSGWVFGSHSCFGLELSSMIEKDAAGFYQKIPESELRFPGSHIPTVEVQLEPYPDPTAKHGGVLLRCDITVAGAQREVSAGSQKEALALPKPKKRAAEPKLGQKAEGMAMEADTGMAEGGGEDWRGGKAKNASKKGKKARWDRIQRENRLP